MAMIITPLPLCLKVCDKWNVEITHLPIKEYDFNSVKASSLFLHDEEADTGGASAVARSKL